MTTHAIAGTLAGSSVHTAPRKHVVVAVPTLPWPLSTSRIEVAKDPSPEVHAAQIIGLYEPPPSVESSIAPTQPFVPEALTRMPMIDV